MIITVHAMLFSLGYCCAMPLVAIHFGWECRGWLKASWYVSMFSGCTLMLAFLLEIAVR